jgi:hypothetical protein
MAGTPAAGIVLVGPTGRDRLAGLRRGGGNRQCQADASEDKRATHPLFRRAEADNTQNAPHFLRPSGSLRELLSNTDEVHIVRASAVPNPTFVQNCLLALKVW